MFKILIYILSILSILLQIALYELEIEPINLFVYYYGAKMFSYIRTTLGIICCKFIVNK